MTLMTSEHIALAEEITELKEEFAEPLYGEVKNSPILGVVEDIMGLKTQEELSSLESDQLYREQSKLAECKRKLEEISYEYVLSIMDKPEPSKVFKILENSNRFEKILKKAIGKEVKTTLEDGTVCEIKITPKIVKSLTRYRFSIGTPPVVPEGIELVEQSIFGDTLQNIYGFRELLGGDRILFDKFMAGTNKLIEESTHYTTGKEKKDHEKESNDYMELTGMKGFSKTTISGTANTAIRLISEELLHAHHNGSLPLRGVEGEDFKLDDDLRKTMRQDRRSFFVVRINEAKDTVFSKDRIKDHWKGLIGRLIIIDESEKAVQSGSTFVYSMIPAVTNRLAKFHVKKLGTPANTQINLRRILEYFDTDYLHDLKESVDEKIDRLEQEEAFEEGKTIDNIRVREWHVSVQKDFTSLIQFRKFLNFIISIAQSKPEDLERMQGELMQKVENQTMDYLFSDIKDSGYECTSIPSGGGRLEIGIVGKYHLEKSTKRNQEFKEKEIEKGEDEDSQTLLSICQKRLKDLKEVSGILENVSETQIFSTNRALAQIAGPGQALRGEIPEPKSLQQGIENKIQNLLNRAASKTDGYLDDIKELVHHITSQNISGELRVQVADQMCKFLGIPSASKRLESGKPREAADEVRGFLGRLAKTVKNAIDGKQEAIRDFRRGFTEQSVNFAENIIIGEKFSS